MNIAITVSSKIATLTSPTYAVNDNTDYTVVFTFDSEWDSLASKTARFAYLGGYTDVVFSGTSCTMPKLSNCDLVLIGVYAGNLHTTTPAKLPMVRSILKSGGSPIAPSSSVYDQIMALMAGKMNEPATEGASGQVLTTDGAGGRSWTTAGGGTSDHSELDNLDYASSGHTGFAASSHTHTTSDITDYPSTVITKISAGTGVTTSTSQGQAVIGLDSASVASLALADTALQSVPSTYRTSAAQDIIDATKQGVISDLSEIRSGAALGATAYQKPASGIPATDMTSAVQTSLGLADSSVQPLQSTLLIDRTLTEDAVLNFTQDDNGNALSLDYCRVIIYFAKGSATAQQSFTLYVWSSYRLVASAYYGTISTTILSGARPGSILYFYKKSGIWESLFSQPSTNIGGVFSDATVGTGINWLSFESAFPKITNLTTTAALLSGTRIQVYGV